VAPDVHRFGKKRQSWISNVASWRRKITHIYLNVCRKGIKAGSIHGYRDLERLIALALATDYREKRSARSGSDLAYGISEGLVLTRTNRCNPIYR
jgi:hypothetical protein